MKSIRISLVVVLTVILTSCGAAPVTGGYTGPQIMTLNELNDAIAPSNLDSSVFQNRYVKNWDRSRDIPGKETIWELYLTKDGGRIATSKYNEKIYSFAGDHDRTNPFDYARIDLDGDGRFETEIGTNEYFSVPEWATK